LLYVSDTENNLVLKDTAICMTKMESGASGLVPHNMPDEDEVRTELSHLFLNNIVDQYIQSWKLISLIRELALGYLRFGVVIRVLNVTYFRIKKKTKTFKDQGREITTTVTSFLNTDI